MEKTIIKGFVVEPRNQQNEYGVIEFVKESYRDISNMLGCDLFTVASRKIGNKYYDIYCDDEFLLKNNLLDKPTLITTDDNDKIIEVLFGKIFICNALETDEGITMGSLSSDDINCIYKNIVGVVSALDKTKKAVVQAKL